MTMGESLTFKHLWTKYVSHSPALQMPFPKEITQITDSVI